MAVQKVAVVGLGRMGQGMLATLARAGVPVIGYDVSAGAREAAATVPGAEVTADLAAIWREAETIVLSLPFPATVEAVLTGEGGLAASPARGRLVIDTSTSDPDLTRALHARLASVGHALVDAPVSGGPAGAAAGTLAIMVGGTAEAVDRARPVLDVLGQKVSVVGGPGDGHIAKLVNNVLVAGQLILAGEAMRVGVAAGASQEGLITVVNGASGRSAVTEVNYPRWIASGSFDSGFTMGLMAKDVGLALELAERTGLAIPMLREVRERWNALTRGWGPAADFNRAVLGDPA